MRTFSVCGAIIGSRYLSFHRLCAAAGIGLLCGLAVVGSAQITRVANTALAMPQTPQTFGYTTENAFAGLTFSQPLAIVSAPGETDRLFVVEKTGVIQAVTGLSGTPTKKSFLDLTAEVVATGEAGVLGLAFHPDFATNGYFYVFYSTTATTSAGTGLHQRISRFTALAGSPTNGEILATEVPLISQYDQADNHNAGDLHFGSDNYLYVSLGDEGGGNDQFNNSQRIDSDFFSGLLRLDVDQKAENLAPNPHASVHAGTYKIPADNPFVNATSFNGTAVTAAKVRTEFWAVGLRNPWRFSFDPPTGRLLLGDVGQGAREEIDLITRGGNYGWSYREGTIAGPRLNPPAGASFIDPIWDADRGTAGSITGGVVYRGSRFAQLSGQYIFGDYLQNRIFSMTFPASGPVQVQQITTESSPSAFGTDPRNGDILIANIGGGTIRRLVYTSTPTGTALPATLSATGAFSSLSTFTPSAGVVAYEPNISFWSDYAVKRRWFSIPAIAAKVTFAADVNWTFPAGTTWIKHFDLELTRGVASTARRLETRLLVKTAAGVYGVTYRWNPAQTEASLVPEEGASESIVIQDGDTTRSQVWRYPSRAECLECHTPSGGYALSFNTAQLNRSITYSSGAANQLTALANAGYFTAAIPAPATLRALAPATDNTATIEHRARSYLAANCVQCHQPGGSARGNWDARIATATASAGLINGALVNSAGDAANRVVAPGDLVHSQLLARVSLRGATQMPPLGSSEIDAVNVALLTTWISELGPVQFTTQPASVTTTVGGTVTFSAVASGSPAPTYQWRKNGVSIAGATGATLTLTNVQLGTAGSYSVVASNSSGSATSDAAGLTVRLATAGDFDRDGQADLVWQNTTTGERSLWLMNGATLKQGVSLGTFAPDWAIVATGDFNRDGQSDFVWQNSITGECSIWLMNGTSLANGVSLGRFATDLTIAGTGDFNHDGQPDIVWQIVATGHRHVTFLSGTTPGIPASIGSLGLEWVIAAVADFNADGKADLVWQNAATGEAAITLMNGTIVASTVSQGIQDRRLQIVASADYNGDGKPDLVWTDLSTGERSVWLMAGAVRASTVSLATVGTEWTLGRPIFLLTRTPRADFNADGKSDLFWQNGVTGGRSVWLMDGLNFTAGVSLGTEPTDWLMNAIGDFNRDEKPDLVWTNLATGVRTIWLMNGAVQTSTLALGTIPVPWQISATGDFNYDGKTDLVWTNQDTGERSLWLMNGAVFSSGIALGRIPTVWVIAVAADMNGDGKVDLVWENTATGERSVWLMNGGTFSVGVVLPTTPVAWSIVGSGDFNADGKSDLVLQNSLTGERVIWLMDGTTFLSSTSLGAVPREWTVRN